MRSETLLSPFLRVFQPTLPVHHHSADYIFWHLGSLNSFKAILKIKFRFGRSWGRDRCCAPLLAINTVNLTESAIFMSLAYSLLRKDFTIQNVLY